MALIFAHNEAYTTVVELQDPEAKALEIKVDLEHGTWTALTGEHSSLRTNPVGIAERHYQYGDGINRVRSGVIGLYDRTQVGHLKNMISASREATESRYVHAGFED